MNDEHITMHKATKMHMSPKERALDTIANEKRREIILLLEKEGDRSLSEIQTFLGVDKGTLTYQMKELVKAGLVANMYERRTGSMATNARLHSYYKLTSFGEYVMDWYRSFSKRVSKSGERDLLNSQPRVNKSRRRSISY
jgi:predicted transcriptional regulator